jgi:hypothetical protein
MPAIQKIRPPKRKESMRSITHQTTNSMHAIQKIRPPDKNNVSPKEKEKKRNNQGILGKSAYDHPKKRRPEKKETNNQRR